MSTARERGNVARTMRASLLPSHEERRRIINAPFWATTVHTHSTPWGGVYVRDSIPVDGRRVWEERPEDEEWMRNKWEEK